MTRRWKPKQSSNLISRGPGKGIRGFVYVVTNESMPGLVKVGYSAQDPMLRAAELNNTGSPFPYVVDYEALVNDPYEVEQQVHQSLADVRVVARSSRGEGVEWFRCSSTEAAGAIKAVAGDTLHYENFRRAERDAAEKVAKEKRIVEDLEKKMGAEERAINQNFEQTVGSTFPEKPFWMYWVGGFFIVLILTGILSKNPSDAQVFWVSLVAGCFIGFVIQAFTADNYKTSAKYLEMNAKHQRELLEVRQKGVTCSDCGTLSRLQRADAMTLKEGHTFVCPKCRKPVANPYAIAN